MIDLELARQLQPSVGLRNVLTHGYVDTDPDLVARAAGHESVAVHHHGFVRAYAGEIAGRKPCTCSDNLLVDAVCQCEKSRHVGIDARLRRSHAFWSWVFSGALLGPAG